MKAAIIIPVRYGASRLPGKALADIGGKPMIRHVYERARAARLAEQVIVATDDARIADVVRGFGGEAVMTHTDHQSGSERAAQAAKALDADIIVNLQGDEPEIDPAHIDRLIMLQKTHQPFASTLACPFPDHASPQDPAAVKAVPGKPLGPDAWQALYFSRAMTPYPQSDEAIVYYLHIGIYAFTRASLAAFASAPQGRLERIEKLEQLRILEMGEKIVVGEVASAAPGIDTPEDLKAARQRFK